MPVVLRQFFVTLQQEAPLRPGPLRWLAYGLREGRRLVAVHVFDVFLNVLLERAHRLADLSDGSLGAKFCVAVALHLASTQGGSNKVARQPDTVGQNSKGWVRVGHVV